MQTTQTTRKTKQRNKGAVVPLLALCLVPLMGMLAFSIDYGFLRVVKTDLQRAADTACLAALIDLVPNPDGTQNLDDVRARVREYVQDNMSTAAGGITSFTVLPEDIEIGRYDENTIYDTGPVTLHQTGLMDAVRVTLRRDSTANGPVPLYFAKVMGIDEQPVVVTATAVLRRGIALKGGADVLPFALPEHFWDSLGDGEELNIYNDNNIEDGYGNQVTVLDADGNSVPGNWGTVDIGLESNSTRDLSDQIVDGLDQSDLNALHADGRIPTSAEVKAPVTLQAETGLSVGMKDAVRSIHGQTRIIPIYDVVNGEFVNNSGTGNNAEFHTIKWGVVEVVDSRWNGNKNTWIRSIKAYTYDGALIPKEDLGDKSSDFENAFASPVLVR